MKRILVALLLSSFALPVAAKTYTKVEVLDLYYQLKLSTSYDLDNHNCDYDFSTSDIQFYIANAYTDGTIDDGWVRYLDHKYKNLTGEIKSKNKKYYQITLRGDASVSTAEYGRVVLKLNVKKKDPYATSHGTVTVKRTASDAFDACSSKATY